MSDPYSGTPTFHGTIDVVTDDDEANAAPIATPLEQLQDEVIALHGETFEIRAFLATGAHTYNIPTWAYALRIICVGHGGKGATGAGAGAGGGAAGEIVDRWVVLSGLDELDGDYANVSRAACTINVAPPDTGQASSVGQVGVTGGIYVRARSAYVTNGGDGVGSVGGTGGLGGTGLGLYAADGGNGGNNGGTTGGARGDDGYNTEGPSAPGASLGGKGGYGFGAGGGGGGESQPAGANGGNGGSGFSGALIGVNVAAQNGAPAAGGSPAGGLGAQGVVMIIAYGKPPIV